MLSKEGHEDAGDVGDATDSVHTDYPRQHSSTGLQ